MSVPEPTADRFSGLLPQLKHTIGRFVSLRSCCALVGAVRANGAAGVRACLERTTAVYDCLTSITKIDSAVMDWEQLPRTNAWRLPLWQGSREQVVLWVALTNWKPSVVSKMETKTYAGLWGAAKEWT